MSLSPAITQPGLAPRVTDELTFRELGLMVWVGLFGVLALSLVGLVLVLHQQAPAAVRDGVRYADLGWCVIGVAAAVGGATATLLAARAAAVGQHFACVACICLAVMAGGSSLAVRAIEWFAVYRYPEAPLAAVYEVQIQGEPAPQTPMTAAAPVGDAPPDAANGAKLYANSCAACHGAEGEGMDGVAPALAATEWLAAQSDEALVEFLKVGRTPGDPASKMGKAMPARGGNASLSDRDLADIGAHLRTLVAAAPAEDGAPAAPAVVAPPKWLTAPPPAPDASLVAAELQPTWGDVQGIRRAGFVTADRDLFIHCLGAIGLVQTVHVLFLMLVLLSFTALRELGQQVRSLHCVALGWFMLGGSGLVALAVLVAFGGVLR